MYKNISLLFLGGLFSLTVNAQQSLQTGTWNAALHRNDGNKIVFNLAVEENNGKKTIYVVNEPEKTRIDDVRQVKDSLFINMPLYESSFRLKIVSKDSLSGKWYKKGSVAENIMPFTASARQPYRFAATNGAAAQQVAGRWKIAFAREEGETAPAIGEFTQQGNKVSGSILTPSGDYRYLAGIVTGDQLWISTFDGVFAMTFNATVTADSLTKGVLYSGNGKASTWSAKKDPNAVLEASTKTRVKDGQDGTLDFTFKDINGKSVSIKDERFKNKVVVIQILGSWCPNCIDETAFLTEYYNKNKDRGVEVIGLAYEYTTDAERTKYSLGKLIKRFDVKYPVLITPVALSDPERTQKTLPQLTDIAVFPTTIILDKSGKVASITSDFYGPGTGDHYTNYVADFQQKINKLLEAK